MITIVNMDTFLLASMITDTVLGWDRPASFCKPATAKKPHDSSHITVKLQQIQGFTGNILAVLGLLPAKIQPSHTAKLQSFQSNYRQSEQNLLPVI